MMDGIQLLGLFAGIMTSGAMMPQLIKTWKSKQVEELSIKMFIVYIIGFIMWITYGFLKSDVPIVATNFISITVTTFLIFLKLKFRKK